MPSFFVGPVALLLLGLGLRLALMVPYFVDMALLEWSENLSLALLESWVPILAMTRIRLLFMVLYTWCMTCATIPCLLLLRFLSPLVLNRTAGRTVARLVIPPLPMASLGCGRLGTFLWAMNFRVRWLDLRSVASALRLLRATHWSLACGQAVSPSLQRRRNVVSACVVARLHTWSTLPRNLARLHRWGGWLPICSWPMDTTWKWLRLVRLYSSTVVLPSLTCLSESCYLFTLVTMA